MASEAGAWGMGNLMHCFDGTGERLLSPVAVGVSFGPNRGHGSKKELDRWRAACQRLALVGVAIPFRFISCHPRHPSEPTCQSL
jgi:hypothetical protein